MMTMAIVYLFRFLLFTGSVPYSLANNNYVLKIVVLDVSNTSNIMNFDITDRMNDDRFAVVQWREITNETQNIREAKSIFQEPHDIWLFTPALCEESFFLETILEETFSVYCVAPFGSSSTPGVGESCPTVSIAAPRRISISEESFCLYPQNKMTKISTILSIVEHLEWKSFILIYDNETQYTVKSLIDILGDRTTMTLYNIDDLRNMTYYNLFDKLYHKTVYDTRNILLMCQHLCVNKVIQKAEEFDKINSGATALTVFSRWLVVDLEGTPFLQEACNLVIDNLAVVSFPFIEHEAQSTFRRVFVNGMRTHVNNLIEEQEMNGNKPQNTSEVVNHILTKDLSTQKDCWRADIFTLLWKRDGRQLSPVGHVNFTGYVYVPSDIIIFPNTKFGFNGRVFRANTNAWQPFSKRLPKVNGTIQYEGYSYDILKVLQVALNFSIDLTEPPDGEWGVIVNGTWTGSVGQLNRREVDLFVGPMAISADRERAIDFIFPYYLAYSAVVFRLPDPNRYKWRKLIDPFKWEVHVCVGASLLCAIAFLYTIETLNPFYQVSRKRRPTFQGIMLYLFGSLLAQGGTVMPSSSAGRSLLAAWWIFCLITVATYSGNLIAFLTVSKEKLPFETLKDLGYQDDYKWGTLEGSVWVSLLQNSNLSVYRRLWEGIVKFNKTDPDVLHLDQDLHRHKVQTENFGYIADKSTAETWVFESCDLTYMKELFFPMNYAFALQNNSPYLQYFDDEMMKIMESGLAQILQQRWWPQPGICAGDQTMAKTISIVDMQSAFYVVLIGIFLASVTILVERVFVKTGNDISLRSPFLKKLFCRT